MADQVPPKTKRRRRLQLEAAHSRNVRNRNRALVGKEILVLVDKTSEGGFSAVARHSGQVTRLGGWSLFMTRTRYLLPSALG
jgi:tRNA A37 methylthiotransferase MiaB